MALLEVLRLLRMVPVAVSAWGQHGTLDSNVILLLTEHPSLLGINLVN